MYYTKLEELLGIAPLGTYDESNTLDANVLRLKAIRVAVLRYGLLVRRENRCGCGRCAGQTIITDQWETEP